jgi:hypothetical protein
MRIFILFTFFIVSISAKAQSFQSGFSIDEYRDLLSITDELNTFDTANSRLPVRSDYEKVYDSPEVGLKNKWTFWKRKDSVGVICIRGTVPSPVSWMANFYAAMIPAEGYLQVNDSTNFVYKLAADKKSTVHVGWTTSLAHMAPGIAEQVRKAYAEGIKKFFITGHSQGGAIAFLVRSYLEYLPGMPTDIQYKTYCSAAPKPGNMFYSYDVDFISRGGWIFRIINAADWVPEVPFSIQRLSDMNAPNPFNGIDKSLKSQPFLVRTFVKSKYNTLNRKTRKAERAYTKNLGKFMFGQVKKHLPQMKEPVYVESQQYMTAGVPIILMPDTAYHSRYPFTGKNIFVHHAPKPYMELANQYYGEHK